ncbi:MAG: hypothetical protein D6725_10705 [Planctomycetota bacterium]|nr:MAG: hypothetical protein D6725_10705 [Planctomycetota bacterium]
MCRAGATADTVTVAAGMCGPVGAGMRRATGAFLQRMRGARAVVRKLWDSRDRRIVQRLRQSARVGLCELRGCGGRKLCRLRRAG